MPRRTSPTPTDAELRVLDVLWDHGPATVADVADRLPGRPPLAYNTVSTLMRILERKGYVARQARVGRAFVFRARVPRTQARKRALAHLRSRLFGGSTTSLVQHLLRDERLAPGEIDALKRLIEEA
jgi:BlaI family penicillinase repressor